MTILRRYIPIPYGSKRGYNPIDANHIELKFGFIYISIDQDPALRWVRTYEAYKAPEASSEVHTDAEV